MVDLARKITIYYPLFLNPHTTNSLKFYPHYLNNFFNNNFCYFLFFLNPLSLYSCVAHYHHEARQLHHLPKLTCQWSSTSYRAHRYHMLFLSFTRPSCCKCERERTGEYKFFLKKIHIIFQLLVVLQHSTSLFTTVVFWTKSLQIGEPYVENFWWFLVRE